MPRGGARVGAGRPKGITKSDGMPSKVVRVSAELSKEQLEAIPSLLAAIDHWESECAKHPDGARYYFLRMALEEFRNLGF